MSRISEILNNPTEPAPRAVRRRLGLGVVILLVAMLSWAIFKDVSSGGISASKIDAGLDELALGLAGDDAHYRTAEAQFVDAASVSLMDPYPAFLIRTGRRLAGDRHATDPQDRIATRVAARDLAGARGEIAALRATSPESARMWLRLLDALELRLDQGVVNHVRASGDIGPGDHP